MLELNHNPSCDKTYNKSIIFSIKKKIAMSQIPCKNEVWDCWNDCWRRKDRWIASLWKDWFSLYSVCVQVVGCRSGDSSPPDVCSLGVFLFGHRGIQAGTTGTVATTSGMGARASFSRLVFVCLSRVFRMILRVCLPVLVGKVRHRWAEAQTLTKGTPVLLALLTYASADGLFDCFTTGQQDVHQFYIWTERKVKWIFCLSSYLSNRKIISRTKYNTVN